MNVFIQWIAQPLGALMRSIFRLVGSYGLTILLFTLITKIILFPVSLLVQKNSIKMVRMRPELDALRFRYVDDKDPESSKEILLERYREQLRLYKEALETIEGRKVTESALYLFGLNDWVSIKE